MPNRLITPDEFDKECQKITAEIASKYGFQVKKGTTLAKRFFDVLLGKLLIARGKNASR